MALVKLDGESEEAPRIASKMAELDRVTGGGFVRGSAVLVGGDPGIGKSTILMQAAAALARQNQRVIYVSGDTDVMADMKIFNDLHAPDIGILCAGGHFTMDMKRAAYAASNFFDFKTVIPCHYKTFPILEQSAAALVEALPGVDVIEPEVMTAIEI